MLILPDKMQATLQSILIREGFEQEDANRIAKIFTASSMDGYHSHGVNRFAEFIKNCRRAVIRASSHPQLVKSYGHIERWDGQRAAGPLNAWKSMGRAIELAKKYVMGCVALSNTNHWMRGGSYGWQAAEDGCIGICFTNTMPNMPPWGGKTPTTGNNPVVISIPRKKGHIVIDMSLSQFSYGKLHQHKLRGSQLPFHGGYSQDGELTTDPSSIIESRRILQTGYWKGAGLSLMIDLLAAILSGGLPTADIDDFDYETGLSQVFICIDPSKMDNSSFYDNLVNRVIAFYSSATPEEEGQHIYYPGEKTVLRRLESMDKGILVDEDIWTRVLAL